MKVLVGFATTEGQTRKIAKYVVDTIRESGHEADLYDCTRRLRGQEIDPYDAIILAGSVHQTLHQEEVVAFAIAHSGQLETKPSAFISVSLSAGFKNGKDDANDYVRLFAEASGWRPKEVYLAAGALKLSEYDFFKDQIIRHIVMAGRQLPNDGRDLELTDWGALNRFVATFLQNAHEELASHA